MVETTCKAEDQKRLLFNCIYKLEAGADVTGVISDMGANFSQLSKMLVVTNEFLYIF